MSGIIHERPGVYSAYDASAVIPGGSGGKVVGLAAKAEKGTGPVLVTSYAAGVGAFGQGGAMAAMLRLLFLNGVTAVRAVAVQDEDYAGAFAQLALEEDVQVVACDSGALAVQQSLRESLENAAAARRERIGVVGCEESGKEALIARAAALNCERMVLVGPGALDSDGEPVEGPIAAAAVAGAIAASADPAVPINGTPLHGLYGLEERYDDNAIDLLVRGGVTPLESVAGVVSPVRGITTRTKTGGAADSTWRELTTILIVDDVIPAVRAALRSRFSRSKNTAQNRGAIRSQVIVELENKLAAEIIDSYGDVAVSVDPEDPTVCLVEFSFGVAHGLNQIYLTAHITV